MLKKFVRPSLWLRRSLAFGLLAVLLGAGLWQTNASRPRTVAPQNPAATPQTTPTPARPRVVRPIIDPDELPPPPTPRPTPTPVPTPTPTPDDAGGLEVDEGGILRIESNLVNLNVRVIDRNNRPINNLQQSDFSVLENGVVQPITFFGRQEVPISYGLAIDTSGSLRSQLPQVIEAGKAIINSNKAGDETFLMRFVSSENIQRLLDFTPDKTELLDTLDNLYVEGGQTAVIDGIFLGAEYVSDYSTKVKDDRRLRALIVVTDGEDRNSYYKQEELLARLREADVQIFLIGFTSELNSESGLIRKSSKQKAADLLTRIAKETGGRAFFPNSTAELPGIAQEIVRDLRTQYSIAYNPTNSQRDGTFRTIRVNVADGPKQEKRIALTRSGRTANAAGDNAAAPRNNNGQPMTRRP